MKRNHLATFAVVLALVPWSASQTVAAAEPEKAAKQNLAFTPEGKEYRFDTGELQGTLRSQGKSLGLTPVVESASETAVAKKFGLCSHYRLLDSEARYGHAAWDWPSTSRVLPDGSVETAWSADKDHPFDMKAVYRWKAPNTLDVTTTVTPRKDLKRLEVFLASYFEGFAASYVYVADRGYERLTPGFVEADKSGGIWQMFPRDDKALKTIGDGRWKRPPNPVAWKIMRRLEAPLAMRRDVKTGLTALIMAPAEDCFAVSTPCSGEGHRSIYLSLLGRDIGADQTATARSRLVIGRNISDKQAVVLYRAYLNEIQRGRHGKR